MIPSTDPGAAPYDLADSDRQVRPVAARGIATTCPKCGLLQRAGAEICLRCGSAVAGPEADAGRREAASESRPCVQCGYELRGLPHSRCPECGAANPFGSQRRRKLDAISEFRSQRRVALLIGGGLAIFCLALMSWSGDWRAPVAFAVLSAVELPLAVAATFLLSHFAIELDDPWSLTTSRLFAVQMIAAAAMMLVSVVCFPAVLVFVPVYIVAVSILLELDLVEAFVLGFTLAALRVGVVVLAIVAA